MVEEEKVLIKETVEEILNSGHPSKDELKDALDKIESEDWWGARGILKFFVIKYLNALAVTLGSGTGAYVLFLAGELFTKSAVPTSTWTGTGKG